MAYNGSGTFNVINTYVYDTVISETDVNANFLDIATGLSTAITKDGQTAITANIPFASYKITGLGDGTAKQDAAAVHQIQDQKGIWCGTAGGTADDITLTPSPAIAAYAAGQTFSWVASGANTGAVTVAVSGLAAKAVRKNGTTALAAGDIPSGALVRATYDTAGNFQITVVADRATLTANTFTGAQTLSGASLIDANASIAAHATTMNPWSSGNYVTPTGGAVTFTNMAAAPQAGAEVEMYMNAAHTFTDGAVFEVDGNADYTATIGDRVLIRAKSTTVFTVHPRKANGTAVAGVGDHEVIVHTGNGYGSTATKRRRFTTVLRNVGTAITYADSAANGGSFTINEAGLYKISRVDQATSANIFGLSVNGGGTTDVTALAIANRLAMTTCGVDAPMSLSRAARFAVNDVIYAHDNGAMNNTTDRVLMSIIKVAS